MQGEGLLLRGGCSIINSHGEQVHVSESFVMWFNTITLKQFIGILKMVMCLKLELGELLTFLVLFCSRILEYRFT